MNIYVYLVALVMVLSALGTLWWIERRDRKQQNENHKPEE